MGNDESMIDEAFVSAIKLLVSTAGEVADVFLATSTTSKIVKAAMLADNVIEFTSFDYGNLAEKWKAADEIDRTLIKEAFAEAFTLPVDNAGLEAKIETIFGWAVDLDRILREAVKMKMAS